MPLQGSWKNRLKSDSITRVLCGSSAGWGAHLAFGRAVDNRPSSRGHWLSLPSDTIAAYCVSTDRTRTFVFRTIVASTPVATTIPGLSRSVCLLIELRTRARLSKLLRLFAYLIREGHDPNTLSDAFYLQVGSLLVGRLPAFPLLPVMLENEQAPYR